MKATETMKQRVATVLLLFGANFASCRQVDVDSRTDAGLRPNLEGKFRIVRNGSVFGYVVDAKGAKDYYPDVWEPDDSVIQSFENRLAQTAFAVTAAHGRQYVGTHNDGAKILYVTFFCDHSTFSWHSQVGRSADGEPCLLRAMYFVDTQRIAPLFSPGSNKVSAPQ